MKVPLSYGPKEKFLARAESDLERPIAIQLPRMSFEIIDYQYDPSRKLISTNTFRARDPNNPNQSLYQYNPIPWNLTFNLYVVVKNAIDGTRIVEQILPFFSPEFTGTLNINTDMGVKYDIPVSLNSVTHEDTYEGPFEQRRQMIWTLTFTMKGWLFGPTRHGSIIKQVELNFKIPQPGVDIDDAIGHTDNAIEVVITPGLTANGQPTSNASLTIDKSLIEADDDYGYVTVFEEFY